MPELSSEGRHRIVVTRLSPEIDCGRFPIKRVIGESVIVESDVFGDSHDLVACQILYWRGRAEGYTAPMKALGNDRWRGQFVVTRLGTDRYTVEGWIDRFQTWRPDLEKRVAAGQDFSGDVLIGVGLIEAAASRAQDADAELLGDWALRLRENHSTEAGIAIPLDSELLAQMQRYPDRELVTRHERELSITVGREKARFSTWYEVFPRSCSSEPGRHGTFRDCEQWLPYVAAMGFDVLYLSPIHPIGETFPKGKNNSLPARNHHTSLDWHLLDSPLHSALLRWVRDLNTFYRGHPALYELDFDPLGFSWVDCSDSQRSVISFLRRRRNPEEQLLFVCNFTPVVRRNYRVGAPAGGFWKEVRNGDASLYGGSGQGNLGGLNAAPLPIHGQPFSLNLTLPPLGILVLQNEPSFHT